jgi:hypothetical protein
VLELLRPIQTDFAEPTFASQDKKKPVMSRDCLRAGEGTRTPR